MSLRCCLSQSRVHGCGDRNCAGQRPDLTKLETSSRMVSPTFAVNSRGSSNCDVAATPSCWVRRGSHTGAKRSRTLSISRPARRQRQDAEDEARLDEALDDLKGIGLSR